MLNLFYHICSYFVPFKKIWGHWILPMFQSKLDALYKFLRVFPCIRAKCWVSTKIDPPSFNKFSGCKTTPPPTWKLTTTTKKATILRFGIPHGGLDGEGSTIWRRNASRKSSQTRPWCLGARISSVPNRRVGKLESPSPKKEVSVWEDESFFVHMFLFFKLGDVEWCLVMFFFWGFLMYMQVLLRLECVYLSKGASWQSHRHLTQNIHIESYETPEGGGGRAGI